MDRPGLHAGYTAVLRDFRLEFSRGGAYTGIVLILLGMGLDWALYPAMQRPFTGARLLVAALIFCVALAMRTRWAQERIAWVTFAWLLLPQLMIAWMIAMTEGAASIYYVGMTLAIYSSGIVLAFGLWQNMVFGAISCLLYVAACAWHAGAAPLSPEFVVNCLFLLMSASISAVFTYFNERARFMLYQLKAEVAQKNLQLEVTNKDLADIKGQLAALEQDHPGRGVEQTIDLLLPVFGAAVRDAGGTILFLDSGLLTEFLETPTGKPVSAVHAFWLASLLWLARRGWSLQVDVSEHGLQGRVVQAEPALTPDHLAAWIEQF